MVKRLNANEYLNEKASKPIKLKWSEKLVVKRLIKKMKEVIDKVISKRSTWEEDKLRAKLITAILSLGDELTLTDDDTGKDVTESDLRASTTDELIEYLQTIIEALEDLV